MITRNIDCIIERRLLVSYRIDPELVDALLHAALPAPGWPVDRGRGYRAERVPDGELVPRWSPAPTRTRHRAVISSDTSKPADLGFHHGSAGKYTSSGRRDLNPRPLDPQSPPGRCRVSPSDAW